MNINTILLLFSVIIIIGAFSEWVFKKTGISDTLILVFIGFILGNHGLRLVNPDSFKNLSPLFITFTLFFIMFDGSLYINIKSIKTGLNKGIKLAILNFLISSIVIFVFLYFSGFDIILSVSIGFALGGVSSSFIIPLLKQIKVSKEVFSILTFESAITDVFSIVFSLTAVQIMLRSSLSIKNIITQLFSLFSVAVIIGTLGGIIWMWLEGKIVERDKNYFIMIAYITIVYLLTEFLNGNGAIAVLFTGIVLTNSDFLIKAEKSILNNNKESKNEIIKYISKREKMFYSEISFFLKTFFFVYIGLLINIKNISALVIGGIISISIMFLRNVSSIISSQIKGEGKRIINIVFARGIAPAAITASFQDEGIIKDSTLIDIVFVVIVFTIILTSIRIFVERLRNKNENS